MVLCRKPRLALLQGGVQARPVSPLLIVRCVVRPSLPSSPLLSSPLLSSPLLRHSPSPSSYTQDLPRRQDTLSTQEACQEMHPMHNQLDDMFMYTANRCRCHAHNCDSGPVEPDYVRCQVCSHPAMSACGPAVHSAVPCTLQGGAGGIYASEHLPLILLLC